MKRRPLFEETAEQIIKLVISEYQEGSKIPIESELAVMFSVSRTTIREAIKLLCSKNILEIRRGDGTYFRHKAGMVSDPLGVQFMNQDSFLEDMGEVSLIIQPEFAALAARKATKDNIEKMEKRDQEFRESYAALSRGEKTVEEVGKKDSNFHSAMMGSCGNQIIDRMDNLFSNVVYSSNTTKKIGQFDSSMHWHPIIIDAIQKHDAKLAKKVMYQHMLEVGNIYRKK